MTTTTMDRTASATRPGLTRAFTVVGAAIASVAIWGISVPLLGAHLLIRFGSGPAQSVGVDYIIGATVIASLAAWGVLALLERRTPRAHTIWTALAVVVLIASLSLPFIAATTTSARVVLIVMHVAVAAVLIVGLPRGGASQQRR